MQNSMCNSPSRLGNSSQYIPCRDCWKCRENHVNEKTGRMIAESKTSALTVCVTLTYASDENGNPPLFFNKKDIDKFIDALRYQYGKVRYAICGEKGSLKGRLHYHCVLFFQDEVPNLIYQKRIHWSPWPHGFAFIEKANPNNIRYALKYAIKSAKDGDDVAERFAPRYSLKPPLGHTYFQSQAIAMAEQGILPQSNLYFFAEDRKRKYLMTRNTRDNYLDTYVEHYQKLWKKWPHCDVVDHHYEQGDEIYMPIKYDPEKHFEYMADPYTIGKPKPQLFDVNPFELAEIRSTVYGCLFNDMPMIIVTDDNGGTITTLEQQSWHANHKTLKHLLQTVEIQWRTSFKEFSNNPQLGHDLESEHLSRTIPF